MGWSHIACGVFAAAVRRSCFPNCTAALQFSWKSCADLTIFCSPQSQHKPCDFLKLDLELLQRPRRHKHAASASASQVRSPYDGLATTLGWHKVFALSRFLKKIVRSPWGGSTMCKHRAAAVRSPYCCRRIYRHPGKGRLVITTRNYIAWILRLPCGRRNICDHYYCSPQDRSSFKNQIYTS